MESVDVAVVGAGPAGATAARHLALGGLSVRLLEAQPLPRYKTCGGGLVPRARRWLEVDLAGVMDGECHRAEMRFLDHGLAFSIVGDQPVVTMTMRADLDASLVRAARAAGAQVSSPCPVVALEETADRVLLATPDGPVGARFVVAADGAAGRVARWAGWSREPPRAPALESEIRVTPETFAAFSDRALFDFGVVPHGYAWVFPKENHLSVGCLSTRRGARDLRPQLDRYLTRIGIEPRHLVDRQDHGFAIPLAPRSPSLVRRRVLLTGDAAGLADPVICEGISYAALSGRLAAGAIVSGRRDPRRVGRIFQRSMSRQILGELAAARWLARLLYDRPALALPLFRRAGGPLCRAMGEVLAGRATYRSLMTSPASYLGALRRLASRRPSSPPAQPPAR